MSQHIFGAIVTALGTAANNRAENEGNITTLQKLIWNGRVHSTVSAEAIRFALRRHFLDADLATNRTWNEDERTNKWTDHTFERWREFVDDDLLGYMSADAAKEEVDDSDKPEGAEGKKGKRKAGTATIRRAVLEVTRAVSLTPWAGDVTFNAASPGATPSAAKKGSNPVPYGTEVHATRYQYGFALTPGRLSEKARAATALRALGSLGPVAGNHGRFLFDFSPESIVLRIANEAAPRILYGFDLEPDGTVSIAAIIAKVEAGDISATELVIGGAVVARLNATARNTLSGAVLCAGIKQAVEAACKNAGVEK